MEEVRIDERCLHELSAVGHLDSLLPVGVEAQGFKRVRIRTQVLQIATRGSPFNAAGVGELGIHSDETIHIRIPQRLQHHTVKHAEHGRGRSDSQTERHDGYGGKTRIQPQHPAGKAKLMSECHGSSNELWTTRARIGKHAESKIFPGPLLHGSLRLEQYISNHFLEPYAL